MIGVVLSGALDDGSRGLAAIHEAGGLTIVLTPGRSPERGMPENAISYDGPIDLIGDPLQIAEGICRSQWRKENTKMPAAKCASVVSFFAPIKA